MNIQERIKRREAVKALYALERKWGVPADFYKIVTVVPNIELGRPGVTAQKYVIPKMITYSVTLDVVFKHLTSKAFSYGGVFTSGDRLVIFRNTLGITEIVTKDYLYYSGKSYNIINVDALDYQIGWILHLRHTPGFTPYQSHDRVVWSRVTPSQDLEITP